MILLYALLHIVVSLYSYALTDPNFTPITHPVWTVFRNGMVQLGYHERPLSALIFIVLLALLWRLHVYFVRRSVVYSPMVVAMVVAFALFFSYPFLSHDIFSYMFDARIVTFYGQNPYLLTPIEFAPDPWLRFMHWTHRTYPYGPTFLALTLIPSFLSAGKFIVSYVLFKAMFVGFYLIPVYVLQRVMKKSEAAMFWATHPLVLFEGLINMHNDFIAVSLTILGLALYTKRLWLGRVILLFSGLIKYTTLPLLLWTHDHALSRRVALLGVGGILMYLIFIISTGVQAWYFLTLFAILPIAYHPLRRLDIFTSGVLIMYIPFIYTGEWSGEFKYWTIAVCALLSLVYNKRYVVQALKKLQATRR